MKRYAIITAGGSGVRMGGPLAKQLMEIEGKPILRHTIELFLELSFDVEIIVVINSDLRDMWKSYCKENDFEFRYILTSGGLTRFHSVKNAVKYLERGGVVAVHDGVRPLATKGLIERLYTEIESKDALIPVMPVVESLRHITESRHIDRDGIVSVQTPQLFRTDVLIDAYKQPYTPAFTDDASVAEATGYNVDITQGERYNIKITTPEDLLIAKAIFSSR